MDVKGIISVTLILFSVIDIIGSIPIIINMKKKGFAIESGKASVISMAIMLGFLYIGEQILSLFGVDVESFAVAGAIVLFLLGLEMVLGVTIFKEEKIGKKGTIVPIVFPLIAGAGTMTTIISLKAKYDDVNIIAGIVLNIILVYAVLKSSDWLKDKLSANIISVMRKVFGIILLAISIKLFTENFHLMVASPVPG